MRVIKVVEALHEPRSAAVPAASCGGVSPPARTPGGTPGALAGEDACATSAGLFSRGEEAQIKLGSQNSEFGIRQSLLTSAATSFRRREAASRREEALLLSHFEFRIFKVSL